MKVFAVIIATALAGGAIAQVQTHKEEHYERWENGELVEERHDVTTHPGLSDEDSLKRADFQRKMNEMRSKMDSMRVDMDQRFESQVRDMKARMEKLQRETQTKMEQFDAKMRQFEDDVREKQQQRQIERQDREEQEIESKPTRSAVKETKVT